MDFTYTQDQETLRQLARQVLGDHATTQRLVEAEADDERVDRTLWRALAGAGLLGVAIPAEYGGADLGLIELGILLEEVGRAVAPVPVFASLVLGALPIAQFGTAEQRRRLLPGVAGGELVLTAALSEPHNPDALQPVTRAAGDGDGWRLSGVKSFVPAAARAARIVVPAAVDGEGILLALVEPGATGVHLERIETTGREIQYRVELDAVRIAADDVLAGPERGREALIWLVDRAIASLCAMQLGVTDQALRLTAQHVSSREQFDRPLAAFQAVSQQAADAYIDVEGIRLTTAEALWRLTHGVPAADAVAVAKFWAAEAAQRVVHTAQHLHGGVGVDVSYPLHRYFLWAKQLELTLGGGTLQLLRIGELLSGAA